MTDSDGERALQKKVFDFYRSNRRAFPWRETTDRYAVMVSEVMLQQTQAERVVPKYLAWMHRFPDVRSLAASPLREALSLWNGLGYNARGERLYRAAGMIIDEFDGVVPGEPHELIRLPGIGSYTSRSIPIFADNRDIATVDTNIRRILIYELALPESISASDLFAVAESVLPPSKSRQWHNALMDYGALYLTSKRSGIRPVSRQSSFAGSRRWYRGQILRDLLHEPDGMLAEEIQVRYGDAPFHIADILSDMEKDGLLERRGSENGAGPVTFRVPEGS
ncbi:MAG: Fe-S cluster assembly protein HesB [Prosthecochloris sp.]|uniref:Fe-S cluster assembly protein HesB n=1 Tax=Prosthecochloris sp. TaxID=290513 RepID=UPI002583203C|nr:Fe-S cluster assembly protein HesB [Prosthecochloris sp.]MCW8799106.1 Fe-S cluster assembly protein HesB [Prosthecochloris sp.]